MEFWGGGRYNEDIVADSNQIRFHLKKNIKIDEIIKFLEELEGGVNGANISSANFRPEDTKNLTRWNLEVTYDKEPDDNEVSPQELINLLKEAAFYIYQYALGTKQYTLLPKEKGEDVAFKKFWLRGTYGRKDQANQRQSAGELLRVANNLVEGEKEKEGEKISFSPISDLDNLTRGNLVENWSKPEFKAFVQAVSKAAPMVEDFVEIGAKKYKFRECLGVLNKYHKAILDNSEYKEKIKNIIDSDDEKLKNSQEILKELRGSGEEYFSRGLAEALFILGAEEGKKTRTEDREIGEFIELYNSVVKILKQDFKPAPIPTVAEEVEEEGGSEEPEEIIKDSLTLDEFVRKIEEKINERWREDEYGKIDDLIGEIFPNKPENIKKLIQSQIGEKAFEGIHYSNDEGEDFFNYSYSYKDSIDDYINGLAEIVIEYAISKFGKEKELEEKLPEEPSGKPTPAGAKVVVPPNVASILEKDFSRVDFKDVEIGGDQLGKLTGSSEWERWTSLSIAERKAFLQKIGLLQIIQQKYQNQQNDLESSFDKLLKSSFAEIDIKIKTNFENTLYALATQAIIDQVNLEEYINNLSPSDLKKLFGFEGSYQDFKKLLIEYYRKNQKILWPADSFEKGEKIISKEEEKDFRQKTLTIRKQARNTSIEDGGRKFHEIFIIPDSEFYGEIIEDEGAVRDYKRRQFIIRDIWRQYSEEERAVIRAVAEQQGRAVAQMAVYEQERVLANKAKAESQSGAQKFLKRFGRDKTSRNKKRSQNRIAKALNKATLGSVAGATANLIAPGLGTVLATASNLLPEKYRKYGLMAIPAAVAALIAYTLQGFLSTVGGFVGGIIGGASGFIVGGPAGIIPGWMVGTNVGRFVVPTKISAVGDFFGGIGKGVGSFFSGAESAVAAATKTVFGFTSGIATATIAATFGLAGLFSFLNHSANQSAFLTQISEIDSTLKPKYVTVEKVATPNKDANPTGTTQVTYEVEITPIENYRITINNMEDKFRIQCKESPCPDSAPNSSEYETFRESLVAFENKSAPERTIEPGESLVVGTYSVEFDENYSDAAINNFFRVDFDAEKNGEIVTDSAQGSEIVCFGDCPIIGDCWPTDGYITQEPYDDPEILGNFCYGKEDSWSHCGGLEDNYLPDAYDIAAAIGTPIYAIESGTVVLLEKKESGFGHHMVVQGTYGVIYAHMSGFAVGLGDSVDKGQEIGFIGNTGTSTGPHLHFEIRQSSEGYVLREKFSGTPSENVCGG